MILQELTARTGDEHVIGMPTFLAIMLIAPNLPNMHFFILLPLKKTKST